MANHLDPETASCGIQSPLNNEDSDCEKQRLVEAEESDAKLCKGKRGSSNINSKNYDINSPLAACFRYASQPRVVLAFQIVFFIIMWMFLRWNYRQTKCTAVGLKGDGSIGDGVGGDRHPSNIESFSDEELAGNSEKYSGAMVEENEYDSNEDGESKLKDELNEGTNEYELNGLGGDHVNGKSDNGTIIDLDEPTSVTSSNHTAVHAEEAAKKVNCDIGICGNHYKDARDVVTTKNHDSKEEAHSKTLSTLSMFNGQKGIKKLKVFVHIPKTAGTSIIRDGVKELKNLLQGNYERSYYTLYDKDAVMLGFFREPRAHVFSQFMHCKYNPYGTYRNYTGFQKTSNDAKGDAADFEFWLDHYNNPKFKMVDFSTQSSDPVNTAWDCYNPINLQARYMTSHCRDSKRCHQGTQDDALEPPLVEAIQNLEKLHWFGLTEFYEPSLCLLLYQGKGHLPKWCDCNSDVHKARQQKLRHVTHKIHSHDVNRLNLRIKRKIDHITRIDQQLYSHTKDIFMARIVELETLTNTTLICSP